MIPPRQIVEARRRRGSTAAINRPDILDKALLALIIIPAIHMDEDLRGFRNLVGLGSHFCIEKTA